MKCLVGISLSFSVPLRDLLGRADLDVGVVGTIDSVCPVTVVYARSVE